MYQQGLEAVIRDLWAEIDQNGGLTEAASVIDLHTRFGASGSIRRGLIQSDENGENALRKVLDHLIGCHDDWRICCHEAGHAIVAVCLKIPFERVVRGERTFGEVVIIQDPDPSDECDCEQYQLFYAAGASAERLMFGTENRMFDCIGDPLRDDKKMHQDLEICHRSNAFEIDVRRAMAILERDSGRQQVEDIANMLKERRHSNGKEGQLSFDEVAIGIGANLW